MTKGNAARSPAPAARLALPELSLKGPLLVLSPHLDDAAFSCSALLERGQSAEILTVFDGEPEPPRAGEWDLKTGFTDSARSMAVRREENRAAFGDTPHILAGLGLLDLQYSGHDRPASDRRRIEDAIGEWIGRTRRGMIAAPAGAGRRRGRLRTRLEDRFGEYGGPLQHPDHLLVRDAALAVAGRSSTIDLLLYEELPYFTGGTAEPELDFALRSVERPCVPIAVEIDRESKAQRIGAYRSQVAHIFIGDAKFDEAEALPRAERYWHLPASAGSTE